MIRPAVENDRLGTLSWEADIPGLTSLPLRKLVDVAVAQRQCLVNVDPSGVLDGFIVTSPQSFFGRDFIRLLSVASRRRRSGVGSALLAASLREATTTTVFASTNESNKPMRALLRRDGWSYSGRLRGLDEGDPELFFWHETPLAVGTEQRHSP